MRSTHKRFNFLAFIWFHVCGLFEILVHSSIFRYISTFRWNYQCEINNTYEDYKYSPAYLYYGFTGESATIRYYYYHYFNKFSYFSNVAWIRNKNISKDENLKLIMSIAYEFNDYKTCTIWNLSIPSKQSPFVRGITPQNFIVARIKYFVQWENRSCNSVMYAMPCHEWKCR